MNTFNHKSRDMIKIIVSWRLCPNKVRRNLLQFLGWSIGEGSYVHWGVIPTTPDVNLGNNCVIGSHAFIDGHGSLVIENGVRIGSHVKFLTTTHPINSSVVRRTFGKDIDLPTRVGYGSWVATGVTILPGVSIAPGCVIGAGAVLVEDTQPNGLYVGSPARRVKDLPLSEDRVVLPIRYTIDLRRSVLNA